MEGLRLNGYVFCLRLRVDYETRVLFTGWHATCSVLCGIEICMCKFTGRFGREGHKFVGSMDGFR